MQTHLAILSSNKYRWPRAKGKGSILEIARPVHCRKRKLNAATEYSGDFGEPNKSDLILLVTLSSRFLMPLPFRKLYRSQYYESGMRL